MTNATRNLPRALDEVPPPAQWDGIVAAASEPEAVRMPIPTAPNPRGRAALAAAVILLVAAGATAIGLAARSDGPTRMASTPTSATAGPDWTPGVQKWSDGVELRIYLHSAATDEERAAIAVALGQDPAIKEFVYQDKAAAFEEFKEMFKDEPEFAEYTDPEDMPTMFEVVPVDAGAESVQRIKASFDGDPGVLRVMTAE